MFKPQYMSLVTPHPLWVTAGSSPYEVTKAEVQAKMLSGRYRTERMCRFWSANRFGYCLAPSCSGQCQNEDLLHILCHCPSLHQSRENLALFTVSYCATIPSEIQTIGLTYTNLQHPLFVQFILDCSTVPEVITLTQNLGKIVLHHLFHITRTWC